MANYRQSISDENLWRDRGDYLWIIWDRVDYLWTGGIIRSCSWKGWLIWKAPKPVQSPNELPVAELVWRGHHWLAGNKRSAGHHLQEHCQTLSILSQRHNCKSQPCIPCSQESWELWPGSLQTPFSCSSRPSCPGWKFILKRRIHFENEFLTFFYEKSEIPPRAAFLAQYTELIKRKPVHLFQNIVFYLFHLFQNLVF